MYTALPQMLVRGVCTESVWVGGGVFSGFKVSLKAEQGKSSWLADGLNPGIQGRHEVSGVMILTRLLLRKHTQVELGCIWRSHLEMFLYSSCSLV